MTRRLIIFASFHADGDIPAYIRYHLKALSPHAARLVFASNSPVSKTGRDFLAGEGIELLQRENSGYDFAAWRDVLKHSDMTQYDSVVLTNSSIIGPLFDLRPVFERMDSDPCDFWGLTTNRGGGIRHLQSFFLGFKACVTRSEAWREWWSRVEDMESKQDVISKYEMRFSRYLERAGFRSASLLAPPGPSSLFQFFLRKRMGLIPAIPANKYWTNATIHSPLELVQAGFPYLKASLVWGHNLRQGAPLASLQREPRVSYDWSMLERSAD